MQGYDRTSSASNLYSFIPKGQPDEEGLRYFLRITTRIYTEVGIAPGEYDFHNALLVSFPLDELEKGVSITDIDLAKAIGVMKGKLKPNKKAIKRSRALARERQSELGNAITIRMFLQFDVEAKARRYTYQMNIAPIFREVLEKAPQGTDDWLERQAIEKAVARFMEVRRIQMDSRTKKEASAKEEFKRAATHLVKGMIKELSVGASVDIASSRWKYAIEEELKAVTEEMANELREKLCP